MIQKYHSLDTISNFVITKLLFTYKAYILSRIKRAILFDKSKITLKREVNPFFMKFGLMARVGYTGQHT